MGEEKGERESLTSRGNKSAWSSGERNQQWMGVGGLIHNVLKSMKGTVSLQMWGWIHRWFGKERQRKKNAPDLEKKKRERT